VKERFTVHGLRRTFNDSDSPGAGADGMVTRALTGHVTEAMTAHYSTVGTRREKGRPVAGVVRLVPPHQKLWTGLWTGAETKTASRSGSPNWTF